MAIHTHSTDNEPACREQTYTDPCSVCGEEVWYYCWQCGAFFRFNTATHHFVCGWAKCPTCRECGCNPNRPKSNEEKLGIVRKERNDFTISDTKQVKTLQTLLETSKPYAGRHLKFLNDIIKTITQRKCITGKQLKALGKSFSSVQSVYTLYRDKYNQIKGGAYCKNCKHYEIIPCKREGRCTQTKEKVYYRDNACDVFVFTQDAINFIDLT